jgi:hypothetical protein
MIHQEIMAFYYLSMKSFPIKNDRELIPIREFTDKLHSLIYGQHFLFLMEKPRAKGKIPRLSCSPKKRDVSMVIQIKNKIMRGNTQKKVKKHPYRNECLLVHGTR